MIMLILTGVTRSIFRSARGVSVMHANSAFMYERTTSPPSGRFARPSGKTQKQGHKRSAHPASRLFLLLMPFAKGTQGHKYLCKIFKGQKPKAPQFLRSQRPFKRLKSQSASLRSATKAKDKNFKVKGASVPSAR